MFVSECPSFFIFDQLTFFSWNSLTQVIVETRTSSKAKHFPPLQREHFVPDDSTDTFNLYFLYQAKASSCMWKSRKPLAFQKCEHNYGNSEMQSLVEKTLTLCFKKNLLLALW